MPSHLPTLSRFRAAAAALTLALLIVAPLRADYTVVLLSDGLAERTVRPGDEFDLDVQLTSNSQDQHWASVIRLEFSSSGLQLISYDWSLPFATGGEDDASVPARSVLPALLSRGLVPDAPGVTNRVDLFLSNFTASQQGFGTGRLVRLRLGVPAGYVGTDSVRIDILPESFGDGFTVVPARTGGPFRLQVEPASGPVQPALAVSLDQGWLSLTWPASIEGATLQVAADATGGWTDLTETPQLDGDRNRVQLFVGSGGTAAFFRLRFP